MRGFPYIEEKAEMDHKEEDEEHGDKPRNDPANSNKNKPLPYLIKIYMGRVFLSHSSLSIYYKKKPMHITSYM